jgi:hypothetical protein
MDDWSGRKWEPVTEERLLRAIDVLVNIAKEHGPTFNPVLETVRQELHDFRRRNQPTDIRAADSPFRNAS